MGKACEMISVPLGHKICEHVTFVDAFKAFNGILAGKKQFKYTSAEIDSCEKTVKLTEHFVVCPDCGQHTPAYRHHIHEFKPKKRFTRQDAQTWSLAVLSLFELENKTIKLYNPISDKDAFRCMHCGAESKSSDKKVFISFIKTPGKITVTYPINTIGDVVRINWISPALAIDEFPLCESVIFDFGRGTTCLELRTASGELLADRDITTGVNDRNFNSPIVSLLARNVAVKRKLKKLFADYWQKSALPFKEYELDIHKFALATAFIGYEDRSFYSHVPYCDKWQLIDKAYLDSMKKLHRYENLVSVYAESLLPDMKCIKRRMYQKPALFFYLKELEALWEASNKEENFFCAILDGKHVYGFLRFLHNFPKALELYADLCDEELHVPLKEMLLEYPKETNTYAMQYASMSEAKRAEEMRVLKITKCSIVLHEDKIDDYFFSIPDRKAIDSIQTQRVSGYVFTPLTAYYEYVDAGEQLKNCLGEKEFDTPVVVVLQSDRYVAAIQVDVKNNMILQAYLKNNDYIDTDQHFFPAFKKWCKKNNYDASEMYKC